MSVNADDVRQLATRREDRSLDFKEQFYGKDDNAEMAKDIMAIANNLNIDEVGHILFGVAEDPVDHTGIIKGLAIPDWATDSNLQQKVRSLLNRPPSFSWSNLLVDGLMVGVIEIRAGGRPFFPLKDEKKIQRHVALRRIGSSTDIASPDEIIGWFRADDSRRIKDLEIERTEQELAILPRLELGMSTRSNNKDQTIDVINDGYALFLVASVRCTWELRVPEWFAQEQQKASHTMAEMNPFIMDLPVLNGTVKAGERVSIRFSIRWEQLHAHFGHHWATITEKIRTNGLHLPEVLYGSISVECQSLNKRRAATANIGIRW